MDEWETPQWLFNELNKEFNFEVDLCANKHNAKVEWFYDNYLWDALSCKRHGSMCVKKLARNYLSAFMNPPYSNSLPFIKKAFEESTYCKIVCLLKCDTSTKAWAIFWDYEKHKPKKGVKLRFLPKRLKFEIDGIPQDSAPFPSVIVILDRRFL